MTTAYAPAPVCLPTSHRLQPDFTALARQLWDWHAAAVMLTSDAVPDAQVAALAAWLWQHAPYATALLGAVEWAAVLRRCGHLGPDGRPVDRPDGRVQLWRAGDPLEAASARPDYVPTLDDLAHVCETYPTGSVLQRELQQVAGMFTSGDVCAAWAMYPPEHWPLGYGLAWSLSREDAQRWLRPGRVVYSVEVHPYLLLADFTPGGGGVVVDTMAPSFLWRSVRVVA